MSALAAVELWPYCDVKTHEIYPKTSVEGTVWDKSITLHERGAQADFPNAKAQFRARSTDEWVTLFDRAPHIMAQLLGDIFRETRAEAERESGKARIGRRPKRIDGTLEELYAMITPRYSMEPFAESVRELIDASTSLRAFAARAGMAHHTITRMIRGEMALEQWRLEKIAKAGKVHPAYFMEWRSAEILKAVEGLLTSRPNVSVRVHKQMQNARQG